MLTLMLLGVRLWLVAWRLLGLLLRLLTWLLLVLLVFSAGKEIVHHLLELLHEHCHLFVLLLPRCLVLSLHGFALSSHVIHGRALRAVAGNRAC